MDRELLRKQRFEIDRLASAIRPWNLFSRELLEKLGSDHSLMQMERVVIVIPARRKSVPFSTLLGTFADVVKITFSIYGSCIDVPKQHFNHNDRS